MIFISSGSTTGSLVHRALGGSNETKPWEVLNRSDLHNQGSTNTRNLRRILHVVHEREVVTVEDMGTQRHLVYSSWQWKCVKNVHYLWCGPKMSVVMYCCHSVEENCSIAKWCEDASEKNEDPYPKWSVPKEQSAFVRFWECTSCAIYVYDQVKVMSFCYCTTTWVL
jgi:hypothetical protein